MTFEEFVNLQVGPRVVGGRYQVGVGGEEYEVVEIDRGPRATWPSWQITVRWQSDGRVLTDSPGRDDRSNRSLNAEWVEFTNTTRNPINLRGWTLRDSDGNRYRFDNVRLGGRDTIRIHTGNGRDTRTDLFQDRRDYVWDNRSDTATLRDDRGRTVDTESWGRRR
ncbi:lamin tail domain-containing protein [Streptomyces virginiae]|uniref:lamin tail domain-containing protein n=1 Tax=Streptomyces virginiae TaxID=1961 RepID=UPI0033BD2894